MMVVLALLFFFNLSFCMVVEWKEKPIVVRVPEYSVLTIELPCLIHSVAHLKEVLVSVFPQNIRSNSLHVAVGNTPTSLGITCEEEGIVRSYNVYIIPSKTGTTYLKIKDGKLERLLVKKRAVFKGKKETNSVLEEAKELLKDILLSRVRQGYRIVEGRRTYRAGSLKIKEVAVWSGRLVGILYEIENVSLMKIELHPRDFVTEGVVLVYLEGTSESDTTVLGPGEKRRLVIVRVYEMGKGFAKKKIYRLPVR